MSPFARVLLAFAAVRDARYQGEDGEVIGRTGRLNLGSSIAVIGDEVAHFLQLVRTSRSSLFRLAKIKCHFAVVHVVEV